jgi:hypothetical protein
MIVAIVTVIGTIAVVIGTGGRHLHVDRLDSMSRRGLRPPEIAATYGLSAAARGGEAPPESSLMILVTTIAIK